MRFARFWAKAADRGCTAWGWSDASLADAQTKAEIAAPRIAAAILDRREKLRHSYGYGDERPLREPTLREFRDDAGALNAVLTRNAYGCQVLNTALLLMADIDLPEPTGGRGLVGRWFGTPSPDSAEEVLQVRAEKWLRSQPGWSWRLYRTKAGLRVLVTHADFVPMSDAVRAVFEGLDADPLYRRLCVVQNCFRARLTPKPWRCAAGNPPARWPFTTAGQEAAANAWIAHYEQVAAGFATCRLAAEATTTPPVASVSALVRLHDETTRITQTHLPLA